MSERMIIDALPVRNNILLGISEHGNVTHWMYYPAAPKD